MSEFVTFEKGECLDCEEKEYNDSDEYDVSDVDSHLICKSIRCCYSVNSSGSEDDTMDDPKQMNDLELDREIIFTSPSNMAMTTEMKRDNVVYLNAFLETLSSGTKKVIEGIENMFDDGETTMYFAQSLMMTSPIHSKKPVPSDVLFDVIVFSPTRTTIVLTVVTGEKTRETEAYNSLLARSLTTIVRRDSVHNFTPGHIVLEEKLFDNKGDISYQRVIQPAILASTTFAIPETTLMDQRKFTAVVECFRKHIVVSCTDVAVSRPMVKSVSCESDDDKRGAKHTGNGTATDFSCDSMKMHNDYTRNRKRRKTEEESNVYVCGWAR